MFYLLLSYLRIGNNCLYKKQGCYFFIEDDIKHQQNNKYSLTGKTIIQDKFPKYITRYCGYLFKIIEETPEL